MKLLIATLLVVGIYGQETKEELRPEGKQYDTPASYEYGQTYGPKVINNEYPYGGANYVACDYSTYNDYSKSFDCRDYSYPSGEVQGRYCSPYYGYCCPYTGECYTGGNWQKASPYCPYCNKCYCYYPGKPDIYHDAYHQYAAYEPNYLENNPHLFNYQ